MTIKKFPIIWKLGLHVLFAGILIMSLFVLHIRSVRSMTYDAIAINLAGSERMRSFKIVLLLKSYAQDPVVRDRRLLVETEISTFEDILDTLRYGNTAYGLKAAENDRVVRQLDRSKTIWKFEIKPALSAVLRAAETGAAGEILSASGIEEKVFGFVEELDLAVNLIEEHSSTKVKRQLLGSYAILFLMSMTGLSSLILIQRIISRPIRRLTAASNIIATGDLSHRISIDTRDEIGELATSFNVMAARLEESHKVLLEKETLAALGAFASGVAHEIKNPLSSVKMNLRILYKQCPKEDTHGQHFRIALSEVDHMDRILNDILDFSRPVKVRLSSEEIGTLIDASLHMAEKELKEKDITVVKEILPMPPTIVDAGKIKQALLNICLNAAYAMEIGGKLDIKAFIRDDRYVIIMEDDGAGMSPEVCKNVFEPFFTTRPKGTGLGMSMAKRAMEQHNGRIDIDTALGRGTKITLNFTSIEHEDDPNNR